MADALVVENTMGEAGIAAISLCLPLFMLINLFMDGLDIGESIYFSQKLGEVKSDSAVNCFNRIIRATLICGILIAILVNAFAPQVMRFLGTTSSDGELYYACESYMKIIALGAALSTLIGSFVAICCYLPGIVLKQANILKIKRVKLQPKETFYASEQAFPPLCRICFS